MNQDFVKISGESESQVILVPTENDNTILLATISSQFAGSIGLRYTCKAGTVAVKYSDHKFYPPAGGWSDTTYFCVQGNPAKISEDVMSGKCEQETMEDLFTIHGYSKPTNYGDAMLLIGLLLSKLNVDEGILSAVYCRSVLEEFKKNFLLNYLPARTKKKAEVLKEAYQKFYDDPVNAGSRHVRECLKINGTVFAENCLAMYKNASDLIHTVAQLYKKYRTLDGIRKLLQDLPKSGEMERACLTAIVTLPSPSTAAVQGGPIDFETYYQ